jgi:hypothetical protein
MGSYAPSLPAPQSICLNNSELLPTILAKPTLRIVAPVYPEFQRDYVTFDCKRLTQ